jgi:predicted CXXCH cytochrome family protein
MIVTDAIRPSDIKLPENCDHLAINMNKRFFSTIAALSAVASFSLLLLQTSAAEKNYKKWNIANYSKYKDIPGATRAGSEACATCHAEIVSEASHAYHAQQGVECEDCHGNGSLHVEGGGDVKKIISYRQRSARDANGACLSCHAQNERVRNWMAGKHSSNSVRCTDCHTTHGKTLQAGSKSRMSFDTATRATLLAASVSPETDVIVRSPAAANDACLKCHQTEGAQLSMPYHHPLREGKMSCADCHDPHGGPGGNNLRASNANQLCLSCHAQYRGPFAYQHPPVTENCMLCHTAHGSPNTNLLSVSEPALCLQCHAGHHNGAGLPLPDRCTNCHVSIHGTDTPTPSGGSRFVDKGPSEAALNAAAGITPMFMRAHPTRSVSTMARPAPSPVATGLPAPAEGVGTAGGALGMLSAGILAPLSGGTIRDGITDPTDPEQVVPTSFYSITPGAYRFVDGSGFLGRVGEYDSLQPSAGTDAAVAYVLPVKGVTVVSRANVLTGDDYNAAAQLTAGERLRVGLAIRSFEQQQDNYPFYAFPVLDVPPGSTTPPDSTTNLIPSGAPFSVVRRLGSAYARVKVPQLPVHVFVKGDWNARAGLSQLSYLDENTTAAVIVGGVNTTCGAQCHHISQFQGVNYTTRNIGGGVEVKLHQIVLRWEHDFSSFNDRLTFPTGTYTGPFTPENEGFSSVNPPPSGPAPSDVPAGNYFLNIPSPNQSSTDSLSMNWVLSPQLTFNGQVSYTRLRDTFTRYSQNTFGADETLNWHPLDRLQVTADYHQQNLLNDFTPYYSLYGNVSYHNHREGLRLDYELPKGFGVETYYQRSGITRSNASLWPQIYSINNTDLLTVVPSSFSNTTGLALRYHDGGLWSARAGYEWTGTHDPGYLIVPQSNNRTFADVWLTPASWLVLSNDTSIIVQNAFPAISLLRADGSGVSGDFQRRNRFYMNTLSSTLRFVSGWNLGLGYSYQQNNLTTYMAFQNDASIGYVVDELAVPYKQITQAYWGDTTYTVKKRLGLNLRITYNSSRGGMRPDVNPPDANKLGNAGITPFDPNGLFTSALSNVQFGATQVSEVIVPEWIGQGKSYYLFPHKFEGGLVIYYGSYRDYFNPNLNGVLRTFSLYVGRSW